MPSRSIRVYGYRAFVVLALVAISAAGWYLQSRDKLVQGSEAKHPEGGTSKPAVRVQVASPRAGGMDRVCVQPATVEPFQSADLYAKVSGFLIEQTVDIGSPVKAGDVLARISVPEYEKQVEKDAAEVGRVEARVEQVTAAVATAEADLGAATATIALAQADQKSKSSYRVYRRKQLDRIKVLSSQDAVEAKLADEHEDHFQAAAGAEVAAQEAVNTARQKEAAARARVAQAKADLKYARAEVVAAKAQLEKSRVMLGYTVIRSPYTGVVTRRSFHPGDFIKSADQGGTVPVLAVERTDVMRVVLQVPDRDVPYVNPGDPATIEIDALPGETFETLVAGKAAVSRSAASEDPRTRLMRTELDVKNKNERLRRGMYGRVTLVLQPGNPAAVRVPSSALVGKVEGGKASVRVVRDDIVSIVPVRYGSDNGTEVEVTTGLTPSDWVIVHATGLVEEGTSVAVINHPTRNAAR